MEMNMTDITILAWSLALGGAIGGTLIVRSIDHALRWLDDEEE